MPIKVSDVFKSMIRSRRHPQEKPVKDIKVNRGTKYKTAEYFDFSQHQEIKTTKKHLSEDKKISPLIRMLEKHQISRSAPLDPRKGSYYEYSNGFKVSIITYEGIEASSLTMSFDISPDMIQQEKIPGLYHLTFQIMFLMEFIVDNESIGLVKKQSFKEYLYSINGSLSIKYMPSCIIVSLSSPSAHYIQVIEYFFDSIFLTFKGRKRNIAINQNVVDAALKELDMTYFDLINDDTVLRFELLRDNIRRNENSFVKTNSYSAIALTSLWSMGTNQTVRSLIDDDVLQLEMMKAYNRIVKADGAILAIQTTMPYKQLLSLLKGKFQIPFFSEVTFKDFNKKKSSEINFDNIEDNLNYKMSMPVIAIPQPKSIIVEHSSLDPNSNSIEIQWILPSFLSSIAASSSSKPLKVLAHLFESGPLLDFLLRRNLVDDIKSGEIYLTAYSSDKFGFTVFSILFSVPEEINISASSPLVQFIVQATFTYIKSLIRQIDESVKIGKVAKENNTCNISDIDPIKRLIKDIRIMENQIANSMYYSSFTKNSLYDVHQSSEDFTEILVQNMKVYNPSEIMIGNNRFYSSDQGILQTVKHALVSNFRETNFRLYISNKNLESRLDAEILPLRLNTSQSIRYLEIEFDPKFILMLKNNNLSQHLGSLDPLKDNQDINDLFSEYLFNSTPNKILETSDLTFVDGDSDSMRYSNNKNKARRIPETVPFISNPILVSNSSNIAIYYSSIAYSNKTRNIIQSSLSSSYIRWYEGGRDYLPSQSNFSKLEGSLYLYSFISRLLFAIWMNIMLASPLFMYKSAGAYVDFHSCSQSGTALPSNCFELHVVAPSPTFPTILRDSVHSINLLASLDISEYMANSIREAALEDIAEILNGDSATYLCAEKVQTLLLPEMVTLNQLNETLSSLPVEQIISLIKRNIHPLENPNIRLIGLISHIERIDKGAPLVRSILVPISDVSKVSDRDAVLQNKVSTDPNYSEITFQYPILEGVVRNTKTRLYFNLDSNSLVNSDKGNASSLWIHIPNRDQKGNVFSLLLSRILRLCFRNYYIPTSLIINHALKSQLQLIVFPSPYMKQLGLMLVLESLSNEHLNISLSVIMLDFLIFMKQFISETFIGDSKWSETSFMRYFHPSFKQISIEVTLQLLRSQIQIDEQTAFMFGRIVSNSEPNKNKVLNTLSAEVLNNITFEKHWMYRSAGNITIAHTMTYLDMLINDSSMILVEKGSVVESRNNLRDLLDKLKFVS
ncbi:hypothetical protein cand_034940 [Cryptosporidium andersoni]|uniref:Uncharacterized protein n=1 Tax=Cryptosporidium andersoni TaxID=117008 RepID=A0A1J4MZ84_9CRYT|nr:hypothetical protein cand_034940 [Cryptosporidium andersoni]